MLYNQSFFCWALVFSVSSHFHVLVYKHKMLSYLRGTTGHAVSFAIMSTAAQLYKE